MLAQSPDGHLAQGLAAFEEDAAGKLLRTVAGDKLLDHHLARPDHGRRAPEQLLQLSPGLGLPRLRSGGIEEMFLDGGFDGQRWLRVDVAELGRGRLIPRSGNPDRYLPCQLVRIPLVPSALPWPPPRSALAKLV